MTYRSALLMVGASATLIGSHFPVEVVKNFPAGRQCVQLDLSSTNMKQSLQKIIKLELEETPQQNVFCGDPGVLLAWVIAHAAINKENSTRTALVGALIELKMSYNSMRSQEKDDKQITTIENKIAVINNLLHKLEEPLEKTDRIGTTPSFEPFYKAMQKAFKTDKGGYKKNSLKRWAYLGASSVLGGLAVVSAQVAYAYATSLKTTENSMVPSVVSTSVSNN